MRNPLKILRSAPADVGEFRAFLGAGHRVLACTAGYAGVVAALVTASSFAPRGAAVVLYALAVALLMPVGVGVVPAQWVNAFAATMTGNVLGIAGTSLDHLMQVATVVTFTLLAIGNAWIIRALWQTIRRLPGKS